MADIKIIQDKKYIRELNAAFETSISDHTRIRYFHEDEFWYIYSGSATITNMKNGHIYNLIQGNIFRFCAGSSITIKNHQALTVKTIHENNNQSRSNLMINYMVIETILIILGKFKCFMNEPFSNSLLYGAKLGDLSKTLNKDAAELIIRYLQEKTGLSKEIWNVKTRLMTGLRHSSIKSLEENIDFIADILYENDSEVIKNDPTNFFDQTSLEEEEKNQLFNSGIYTLQTSIAYKAIQLDTKGYIKLLSKEKRDIKRLIERNNKSSHKTSYYLNKSGLPRNIRYGHALETAICKLNNMDDMVYEDWI